jgi:hypothetical protein
MNNKNQFKLLSIDTTDEDNSNSDNDNDTKDTKDTNVVIQNDLNNTENNSKNINDEDNDLDDDEDNNEDDNDNDNDNYNNDEDDSEYKKPNKFLNFRNLKFDNYSNKKKPFLNKNNHKKIMCQNFLNDNFCTYKDKCLYAHDRNEQKIDIKRQKIFDILNSDTDLSTLDYQKNKEIYKELQLFTKICPECIINKCTGGNNCRFGTPYQKYLICYDDLNYGSCKDDFCEKIHLTKRNLKPQYTNIFSTINKPPINNIHMLSTFMNNINHNIFISKDEDNINNEILNIDNDNDNDDIIFNINKKNYSSESESDIECDKSIFIEKFNFDDD